MLRVIAVKSRLCERVIVIYDSFIQSGSIPKAIRSMFREP